VTGPVPLPASCASSSRGAGLDCLDRLGFRSVVTYHPPSQYWSFQLIESAIFVGLAVILTGAAVWFTLHHDA
jgi:hypothetical protein